MKKSNLKIIILIICIFFVVFSYIAEVFYDKKYIIDTYKEVVNEEFYSERYYYTSNQRMLDVYYYNYKFDDNKFINHLRNTLVMKDWNLSSDNINEIRATKKDLIFGVFKRHDKEKGDYWYLVILKR